MIGVLVFPDFQLLDAAGPISVFEIAARFAEGAPAIRVLAVTPGPVRSSSGVEILARRDAGNSPEGPQQSLGRRLPAHCATQRSQIHRRVCGMGVEIASPEFRIFHWLKPPGRLGGRL